MEHKNKGDIEGVLIITSLCPGEMGEASIAHQLHHTIPMFDEFEQEARKEKCHHKSWRL